jgi:hypothetical protein
MADVIGTLLGLLELALATLVVALIIIALTGSSGASQSLGDSMVVPAATLSYGAAAIHLWVVPHHVAEFQPYGLAFLVLGLFQARWAAVYLGQRPAWLLRLGLVVNAAVVAIWFWSRTSGLPWGPRPNTPEALGGADLAATSFELGLIAILTLQTWPRPERVRRRLVTSRVARDVRAFVVAVVCVFAFLAVTAPPNGHEEGADRVSLPPSP